MLLIHLCCLSLIASASALNFQRSNGTFFPVFPSQYQVGGIIMLPYAEIKEPFMAFYDAKNNKSRIDYYGNLVQTYQRADKIEGDTQGINYKIAYMVDTHDGPIRTCFKQAGTAQARVEIQTVLPDLKRFNYKGQVPCPSIKASPNNMCELYENIYVVGDKVNKYAFWLTRINSNPVPVSYLMKGYDSLLGSHFDKYEIYYYNYHSGPIDPSSFDYPESLTCRGFPGPGAEAEGYHNPMKEILNPEEMEKSLTEQFESFKLKHGKRYKTGRHERSALTKFRQNLRYINSKNRANLHYKMAVNHLADKDQHELRHLRGRLYTPGYNGGLPFHKDVLYSKFLPEQLDWRLRGAVTPVKDQAICGSCWSFGTTGTIEGQYFVKTGHLVSLSQQQLMDCSWNEGNNACDGGEDFRAYDYIMKVGGIATEDDYGPYLGQDGICTDHKGLKLSVQISGFVNVTQYDSEALRLALFKHGPVTVAIDASLKSLSFYSSGVYYDPKCGNKPDQLDHQVLAVGYGTMNGQDYWLIKNSWSTYWGNDGYVLMSVKDNNCGVMTAPTFPIIK